MKWLIPATAAMALAATPAFAAGQKDNDIINKAVNNSQSQQASQDQESKQTLQDQDQSAQSDSSAQNDKSAQNERSRHPHRNVHAMSQKKLRAALRDAGFTHIRVLDARYVIQAKDDDGNTVFMAINPPSLNTSGETTGSGSSMNDNRGSGSYGDSQASNEQGDKPNWNYRRSYRFDDAYNNGFDQGYREGYNRGYDSGSRY